MPRPPRRTVPGIPLPVVQRGNNRQAVFFHDSDYRYYLEKLFESANRYGVSVHAFVCMTNHVHLLLTPWDEGAASRLMQRLGSCYTAAVNSAHGRTGSLWEGRFHSSLVDSEHYVLACYRYIELNPVRAGMVNHPPENQWSSYRHHAKGLGELPLKPRPEWLAMGHLPAERRRRHTELVASGLSDLDLQRIRYGARKGVPTGSACFKMKVEQALGVRIGNGRRGRPGKGL